MLRRIKRNFFGNKLRYGKKNMTCEDEFHCTMERSHCLISGNNNMSIFYYFLQLKKKSGMSLWKGREPGSTVGIKFCMTYWEVF